MNGRLKKNDSYNSQREDVTGVFPPSVFFRYRSHVASLQKIPKRLLRPSARLIVPSRGTVAMPHIRGRRGVVAAACILALAGCTAEAQPIAQPIEIYVVAPLEDVDAYTITYDCEQHSDTGALLPELQRAVADVREEVGAGWGVFETRRGLCRQTKLMQRGVSMRMDSKHLIGAAVDFVCWDAQGRASWSCTWETLGRACRRAGLIWGGDFPGFADPGHCELPPLQPL